MVVKETDGNQAQLHRRVGQANSRIDCDHIGSASTRAVGKIVHIAGDPAAISAERIDAVSFAKGQVIRQRTPIGVDGSRSQAQLNLKLKPARSNWLPT